MTLFLYNLYFSQLWAIKWIYFPIPVFHIWPSFNWSPYHPLLGEIDICAPWVFCRKLNSKRFLFEAFFYIIVKGTNAGHGTNMGSGLFSVSKKHYLPETIRNIQREQNKETQIADSMTTVSFKEELSLFFKKETYRINIQEILVTKT